MTLTEDLLAAFWAVPALIQVLGVFCARDHFRSVPVLPDTPFRLLPVSILKPLKGVDEGLEDNLRSFFELDYPGFEILFSVASPVDPARSVVESLIREYPRVRARLVVGESCVGLNPKINNLVRSYDQAKYAWILISDSNVRVERRYLKNLVSQIDTDTGMLTSVVLGHCPKGLGGRLEAMYLNTFYAKGMVLASKVNQDCVVGKSMLFRKSSAERFGGLKALGNYLAEDYVAGEAMKQLGLKVATAWHPVPQYVGATTVSQFWKRHVRWGRIRKSQAPVTFLGEGLSSCFLSAVMGSLVLPAVLGWHPIVFLLTHFVSWMLLDGIVLAAVGARIDARSPVDWLIREAFALPIWLFVYFGSTVEWRGTRYRLGFGGVLTPIAETA